MVVFCTSVSPSTSVQARVLGESLRRHHPDARLLAAAPVTVRQQALPSFELVAEERVPSVPALLVHALRDAQRAVYLDPTVFLYAALTPVLEQLERSPVVLVRRVHALPEDGERPDDGDFIAAGPFSAATVGVRASEDAAAFLTWWHRAREEARERTEEPVDSRLLELATRRRTSISICEDPGCLASHWNLHERPLTRTADGIHAGGAPLRSFDFSGFRADQAFWLSRDATRVRVVGDSVLSELCSDYAQALWDAGWGPPRADIRQLDRLGNAQRIDPYVQGCWRQAQESGVDFGDPLDPESADAFVAWMRQPADIGGDRGINRYLFAVYHARPDLHVAFPDIRESDASRLIEWAWSQAGHETLGELVPVPPRGSVRGGIGTEVIGYLGETFGLAEAARLYVEALRAGRVPVSTRTVRPELPVDHDVSATPRAPTVAWTDLAQTTPPVFNLACLNGDHLAGLIRREGVDVLGGRPTIGQWGWETDVLPPSWEDAFPYIDEVWVYSRFMAENLGRLLPVPVIVVPPPIVVREPAPLRAGLLDDERFTFVCMVDLFSTLERKNPGGLVEAFARAFAENEGPRLFVKTINAEHRPKALEELRYLAGAREDITFLDEMLSASEKTALLRRADCYVSLHRSEGFGLPLAEAMALGTPVIATGYSGNLDFMSPANSLLVDWRQTYVGTGSRVYPAHGHWAEPDVDHAAALMREVWRDPHSTRDRAARARQDISRDFSPRAVGEIARARLERLAQASAGSRRRSPERTQDLIAEIERAIAVDPMEGSTGAARLAKRIVLKLMRPFTFHERAVDRAVLDALRELQHDA